MASIRKRTWFTAADLKRIKPEAERLAKAAGKSDWLVYRDEAAAALEIKAKEGWLVAYIDQDKERRFKNFATKAAAKEWSVSALFEVKQGVHTPASISKTVFEAWGLWVEDCEANKLERGTIRQRRQHLAHHVKAFIGDVKLADLTMPLVYDFDSKLRRCWPLACHAPQGHHELENSAHLRPGARTGRAKRCAGRKDQE